MPCSTPYACVSDEHYYPTVLAAHGFSEETTCAGNAMHVDWARAPPNTGSPFTYWMKVCIRMPLSACNESQRITSNRHARGLGARASQHRPPLHPLDEGGGCDSQSTYRFPGSGNTVGTDSELRRAGLLCMPHRKHRKPPVRAALEHLNDMHRPLALQDANLDTFNVVRDQLGKCPFADAIRCAVSPASAPLIMSESTGPCFPSEANMCFHSCCPDTCDTRLTFLHLHTLPQQRQPAGQLRDGFQPAPFHLPDGAAAALHAALQPQIRGNGAPARTVSLPCAAASYPAKPDFHSGLCGLEPLCSPPTRCTSTAALTGWRPEQMLSMPCPPSAQPLNADKAVHVCRRSAPCFPGSGGPPRAIWCSRRSLTRASRRGCWRSGGQMSGGRRKPEAGCRPGCGGCRAWCPAAAARRTRRRRRRPVCHRRRRERECFTAGGGLAALLMPYAQTPCGAVCATLHCYVGPRSHHENCNMMLVSDERLNEFGCRDMAESVYSTVTTPVNFNQSTSKLDCSSPYCWAPLHRRFLWMLLLLCLHWQCAACIAGNVERRSLLAYRSKEAADAATAALTTKGRRCYLPVTSDHPRSDPCCSPIRAHTATAISELYVMHKYGFWL